MKTAAIILIILAVGLVITGCSKTTPTTRVNPTDTQTTANAIDDLNIDEVIVNPDIGTLDDINVSEELPQ